MPELPEVNVIANVLNYELKGLSIISISMYPLCRYFNKKLPGGEYLENTETSTNFKCNMKIDEVYTYGKKIFFKSDDLILFSFLGMTGLWVFDERSHTKLSFELSDGRKLFYDDKRNFGIFKILKTKKEMDECLKSTGIDYFSPKMSFDLFNGFITNKKLAKKTIVQFFENQKFPHIEL